MKTKQQLAAACWATVNQNDGYFLVFLNEKKPSAAAFCQMQDEMYPNTDSIPFWCTHCSDILQAWVLAVIQVLSGTHGGSSFDPRLNMNNVFKCLNSF